MAIQSAQLEVLKTADTTRSKVGDIVNYTIVVRNNGVTTLFRASVNDTLFGNITNLFPETLAPGESFSLPLTHTVTEDDPDPLENTVTAMYAAPLTASETVIVNLFQPSVEVVKSGPTISKVGDTVRYTYRITNTSSGDSPNLILDSVNDTILGDLTVEAMNAGCSNLAPGAACTFSKDRIVLSGDPDPLANTVTVHYHPMEFPNDITDSDEHSVDLVHPNFEVVKECFTPGVTGGNAVFQVFITNTGDVTLDVVATDQGQVFRNTNLESGQVFQFLVTVPVPPSTNGCSREIENTVRVVATIAPLPDGTKLPNEIVKFATAICSVVTLGRTIGFWRNRNGNSILDMNGDGNLDTPVTIGGGPRTINVTTISQSNTILNNRFCTLPGSNCASRSDALTQNTLEILIAQTLGLQYNILKINCYSGQTIEDLGCEEFLGDPNQQPLPPLRALGLSENSTVNQVLTVANSLIANSTSGGTTTQAQAGAMNALLGCLNRESF